MRPTKPYYTLRNNPKENLQTKPNFRCLDWVQGLDVTDRSSHHGGVVPGLGLFGASRALSGASGRGFRAGPWDFRFGPFLGFGALGFGVQLCGVACCLGLRECLLGLGCKGLRKGQERGHAHLGEHGFLSTSARIGVLDAMIRIWIAITLATSCSAFKVLELLIWVLARPLSSRPPRPLLRRPLPLSPPPG